MKSVLELAKWSEGNPGALSFLVQNVQHPEFYKVESTLKNGTSLRGTNIWVLWSDLCGKDIINVIKLCDNCPLPVLEDACSRQDYSGRALVAEYLK